MHALAGALGHPHKSFESVLIAGSKGKGSTAAFLSSILRMENLKTGLYTSPHLADIRERIQVNGLMISQARFAEAVTVLRKALDEPLWRRNPPTHFEALTAIAFHYFKQMKVQVAVLEVGLGGLYDSTNIAEAKVAGLAPIGLEHTDKLGRTLSKIAVQKCGIIKPRQAVVSAEQPREAAAVIEKTAKDNEAALSFVGRDIRIFEREHGESFQRFGLRSPFGNFFELETSLIGRHQIENAALAVGLAKALESRTRLRISNGAVRQGVLDAHWPGRLEKVADEPRIVLDGAHSPDSVRRLVEALKRHYTFDTLVTVFGSLKDKDARSMLATLGAEKGILVATRPPGERAMPEDALAEAASGFREVHTASDCREALEKAKSLALPRDLILVTGSLYLIGALRKP